MLELTKEQIQQLVVLLKISKTVIAVFLPACVLFGLPQTMERTSYVLLFLAILHWFFLVLSSRISVVVR